LVLVGQQCIESSKNWVMNPDQCLILLNGKIAPTFYENPFTGPHNRQIHKKKPFSNEKGYQYHYEWNNLLKHCFDGAPGSVDTGDIRMNDE
jgi:hypothetical protein